MVLDSAAGRVASGRCGTVVPASRSEMSFWFTFCTALSAPRPSPPPSTRAASAGDTTSPSSISPPPSSPSSFAISSLSACFQPPPSTFTRPAAAFFGATSSPLPGGSPWWVHSHAMSNMTLACSSATASTGSSHRGSSRSRSAPLGVTTTVRLTRREVPTPPPSGGADTTLPDTVIAPTLSSRPSCCFSCRCCFPCGSPRWGPRRPSTSSSVIITVNSPPGGSPSSSDGVGERDRFLPGFTPPPASVFTLPSAFTFVGCSFFAPFFFLAGGLSGT